MKSIVEKLSFLQKLNNVNDNLKILEKFANKVNVNYNFNEIDNNYTKVLKISVECSAFDVNEDKQRQCYKQLKCFWPKCRFSCKHEHDLDIHVLHHLNKRQFVCEECNQRFHHNSTLLNHKRCVHSNDRPFVCNEIDCNKTFKLKSLLNLHKKRHSSVKSFGCDKCDKRFKLERDLLIHNEVHINNRPFVCPRSNCNKTFKRKGDLKQHKRKQHSDKRFKCDECDQSFRTEYSLRSHKTIHSKILKFQCDEENCGKKFHEKNLLRLHKIRVHMKLKRHKCIHNNCDKAFFSSTDLKEHVRHKHSTERPFKCNFENCNHSTKSEGNLNKHKKKVHFKFLINT